MADLPSCDVTPQWKPAIEPMAGDAKTPPPGDAGKWSLDADLASAKLSWPQQSCFGFS
jgi:hypothetical protein